MHAIKDYESPYVEIVELAIEGAILQASKIEDLNDFDFGGDLSN